MFEFMPFFSVGLLYTTDLHLTCYLPSETSNVLL